MLVIGAGPAGLKASAELARAGFKTSIVHRSGRKSAEWTVPPEALELLPDKDSVLAEYPEGLIKHALLSTQVPVKGKFFLLDSEKVMKSLREEAQAEGVEFLQEEETSRKVLSQRVSEKRIMATGSSARSFDYSFYCYGAWFEKKLVEVPTIEIVSVQEGFFLYPLEKSSFVCAWRTRPLKNPLQVIRERMGEAPSELIRGVVPVQMKKPVEGNTYFVGDALSSATPVMGEGLRPALLSGKLAARAIATGREYEELLKEEFGFSYRFSELVRNRIWNWPLGKVNEFMKKLKDCDPELVYDFIRTQTNKKQAFSLGLKLFPLLL